MSTVDNRSSNANSQERCTDKLQQEAEANLPFPSFRAHPLTLIRWELKLVFSKILLLPFLFLPLQSPWKDKDQPDEGIWIKLAALTRTAWAGFEQTYLLLASVLSVVGTTSLLFVWGAWGVGALVVSIWFFWAQKRYLQYGTIKRAQYSEKVERPDEEWLFVNGIATGKRGLERNIEFLSHMFQRPVTGVHNKTDGIMFDLVQCILQRDFGYTTQDGGPLLYRLVKSALLSDKKKRVVVICHSQGGIIVSLMLDALLSDVAHKYLQKLEIYTFGSAANHFNSPITFSGNEKDGHPVVKHIEHYVNGRDFVAQIGTLAWQVPASIKDDTRFYGNLFVREDHAGHMFIGHYLESLDPSGIWPKGSNGYSSRLWQYLDGNRPT